MGEGVKLEPLDDARPAADRRGRASRRAPGGAARPRARVPLPGPTRRRPQSRVEALEPRLTAPSPARASGMRPEGDRRHATARSCTVERAGIFGVAFDVPPELEITAVRVSGVEYDDHKVREADGKRVLADRVPRSAARAVARSTSRAACRRRCPPSEDDEQRGRVRRSAARAQGCGPRHRLPRRARRLRHRPPRRLARTGLVVLDAERPGRLGAARPSRCRWPTASSITRARSALRLGLERRAPAVTARVETYVRLEPDRMRVGTTLRYRIRYRGIDTLRFTAPLAIGALMHLDLEGVQLLGPEPLEGAAAERGARHLDDQAARLRAPARSRSRSTSRTCPCRPWSRASLAPFAAAVLRAARRRRDAPAEHGARPGRASGSPPRGLRREDWSARRRSTRASSPPRCAPRTTSSRSARGTPPGRPRCSSPATTTSRWPRSWSPTCTSTRSCPARGVPRPRRTSWFATTTGSTSNSTLPADFEIRAVTVDGKSRTPRKGDEGAVLVPLPSGLGKDEAFVVALAFDHNVERAANALRHRGRPESPGRRRVTADLLTWRVFVPARRHLRRLRRRRRARAIRTAPGSRDLVDDLSRTLGRRAQGAQIDVRGLASGLQLPVRDPARGRGVPLLEPRGDRRGRADQRRPRRPSPSGSSFGSPSCSSGLLVAHAHRGSRRPRRGEGLRRRRS